MRDSVMPPLRRVLEALPTPNVFPIAVVGTVVLFLFAVQLLGAATEAAAPLLRRVMVTVVVDDISALGLGWSGAYVVANGSVVAALALSLFKAELLSSTQLFLMVTGSRLGAAAIVVFIGAVDYLQHRRYSLTECVSMGLLTFLLTLSIYLPVTALGYVAWPLIDGSVIGLDQWWWVGVRPLRFFAPVSQSITTAVGPVPAFLLAVAVLLGSLKVFDRVLAGVDTATLRRRFFGQFRRTWLAFGAGLLITGVTTSVAFSLGVIVPLYNRRYVKREELVPYVLGANLGTLFDTLVVAIVLSTPTGVAVVLFLLVIATAVTLAALAVASRYTRLVATVDDRLVDDRVAFGVFVVVLLLLPLALLLLPLAWP